MRDFFFASIEFTIIALFTITMQANPPLLKKHDAGAAAPSIFAMSHHR